MPYSIFYCIPYVLSFLFLFTLAIWDINQTNKGIRNTTCRYLCFGFLLIFIGLRGFIHTDWISYYSLFKDLPVLSDGFTWDLEDYYMEPGFIWFSIIVKTIIPDYFFWVFLNTLIDLLVLHYLFKGQVKYYVLAFLFFYSFFFMQEVNLYRNTKSIVLFLISLKYVKEKSFIKYLVLNLIGFSFHSSSLLYIIIYPILCLDIPNKILIIFWILGNVIYLLNIPWSTNVINIVGENVGIDRASTLINYTDDAANSSVSIGYVERNFTFLFFLFTRNKWIDDDRMKIYYNCYILYFFFFFYLAEFKVLADRFSSLFVLSYCFLYPKVFECLSFRFKKIYLIYMFIYMFAKEVSGNRFILNKYDNLLWGVESFEERSYDFYRYYLK